MTDVVAAFGGWGRSTWGNGSWNNDNFTTKATAGNGSVTVTLSPNVSVTGSSATSAVGSVKIQFWAEVIPNQNANYSEITPSQTPEWTEIAA